MYATSELTSVGGTGRVAGGLVKEVDIGQRVFLLTAGEKGGEGGLACITRERRRGGAKEKKGSCRVEEKRSNGSREIRNFALTVES